MIETHKPPSSNEGFPKNEAPLSMAVLNIFSDKTKQEAFDTLRDLSGCKVKLESTNASEDQGKGYDAISLSFLEETSGFERCSVTLRYANGKWAVKEVYIRGTNSISSPNDLVEGGFISVLEENISNAEHNMAAGEKLVEADILSLARDKKDLEFARLVAQLPG